MTSADKLATYRTTLDRIAALIEEETDEVAVLATVAGELRSSFPHFDWVGFYRVTQPRVLKIGPYQGGHGCLTIPFARGICGKCAREKTTQLAPDVTQLPYHIACSNHTRSEIVVPILDARQEVRAVLDIDSDTPAAFDQIDQEQLERLARVVANVYC
jgi:GAF domain-containing protein